ncbi:hypothetical protein JCM17380_09270 [Desulfosporosinus burensis]
MKVTSKCSQCIMEQCPIRSNLHKIIQEVIKNAEAEVKQLTPKEIDYMILTDISIIPTRCENYQCRQESPEERDRLFIFRNDMAPTSI